MAIDLWRETGIQSCSRGKLVHRWISNKESTINDIVCRERTNRIQYHSRPSRGRPLKLPSYVWSTESARQVASKLKAELLIITETFTPAFNPSLHSALIVLGKSNKLTSSELMALNSVIGRAPIKNEFDIEALYAREDEIDG